MAKTSVVAVLDIGSSSVSVLIAEKGTNGIYKIHGSSEVDYSGFLDDEFLREGELVDVIGHALVSAQNQAKTKVSSIFVGVPGAFVALYTKEAGITFNAPRVCVVEDIEEIFKNGMATIDTSEYTLIQKAGINYTLSDGRIFADPLGKKSDGLSGKVSYCFAKTSFTSKIKEILHHYNIGNVEFISQNLAEGLFLTKQEERDRNVVLVDIGYITTNVMLVSGSGISFLRSFSLGGGNITADIQECCDVSFDVAEQLKRKISLSFSFDEEGEYTAEEKGKTISVKANDLHEIAKNTIQDIASLVKTCLDSCPEDFLRTSSIYITGGGILYMRGAKEYFAKVMDVTCFQASPRNEEYKDARKTSTYAVLDLALAKVSTKESFFKKIFR